MFKDLPARGEVFFSFVALDSMLLVSALFLGEKKFVVCGDNMPRGCGGETANPCCCASFFWDDQC
jgi:hypothetical protein